jgi:hypothetical protein
MSNADSDAIVAGAVVTGGLLLFEHIALWELRDRLPLVVRYALGTLAIGAGVTYADPRSARVFWPIALSGGALVVAGHLWRQLQFQPADKIALRLGELNGLWRAAHRSN